MKRRAVVHDFRFGFGRNSIYTWCGRTATTKSLVHKRPNCKACRRAVAAYRRRNRRASKGGAR